MNKKVFVACIGLVIFFGCSQKKVNPVVMVRESTITDSIVHKGQTIKTEGVCFVSVAMMISHPRFEKLNEDFGLEPFADIVRKSTYIAVQRDNRTVFVVGGYDANTNSDKMFNVYDRMGLFKDGKQYILEIVKYVFAIPEEYKSDKIYLKIFDKGNFGFSSRTNSGTTTYSYDEPNDVWFEYEITAKKERL